MKGILSKTRLKAQLLLASMMMVAMTASFSFAEYVEPAAVTAAKANLDGLITNMVAWATGAAMTVLLGWITIKFMKKGAQKAT
jgi:hypothetical protein